MVTIQDIGLQLTKPVRELAEWNYPFSQTLETYYSLFNTTCNKSFGEAGLVVQNSTAVYVHRVDCLWSKTEYMRNVFSTYEYEEASKNPNKKRDRKTDINLQEFKTIDFEKEVEKNIDIKKNHVMQEIVKSKSRRFTQLEKSISQHIPIDIYDVNGELIGKKYDFRCNQNISMDGILVDEFAPQDFYCGGDGATQELSSSTSSEHSRVTESLESSSNTLTEDLVIHEDSDENVNSDAESERNDDDSSTEASNLVSSESNQNLSLSRNTDTITPTDKPLDTSNDNCYNSTLTANELCTNIPSDISPPCDNSAIDCTVFSNNNESDVRCLNNNIKKSVDDDNRILDSPSESINFQGSRTPLTDDLALLDDVNESPSKAKSFKVHNRSTSSTDNSECKSRHRSKSTSKSRKRNSIDTTIRKKRRIVKNLLKEFQRKNISSIAKESTPRTDRPNMFRENMSTCMRYVQRYDPLEYEVVTNVATELLGFRLRVAEPDAHANDNVTMISTDDETNEIFELRNSNPASPSRDNFCNVWFRSDSPQFLSENVDKWHELMQPKLHEAERRSTFCIRDYASRIMESLKTSGRRKINFDDIVEQKDTCEMARYFLASLDLASRQNVDINMDEDLEHNIEISLYEEDGQCLSGNEADLND